MFFTEYPFAIYALEMQSSEGLLNHYLLYVSWQVVETGENNEGVVSQKVLARHTLQKLSCDD